MTKLFTKFKEKPLWSALSILFLLFAALLRFLALNNKPIHFDESINMWFVQKIRDEGFFTYDPTNYHGPLMFYATHLMQFLTGFDFISTRWVASIFSFLTVVILWFGPLSHRRAFRWASVFLLMSPAMGFYGRSGIHESAFVFFQVLGFLSFHYLVERDLKKFWWTFVGSLLGMMALKETFVVLILAVTPALLAVAYSEGRGIQYKKWIQDLSTSFKQRDVYLPLLGMLILFVGIYAGFGAHPKGLVDFFRALMPWLKTGVHGSGHEKEFLYWSKLIGANEFATLIGFFGGVAFVLKNKWIRFYVIFTFFLWLIYSLIPYKTPWCIISILWPFAIVSGLATEQILLALPQQKKPIVVLLLLILFAGEFKGMYELIYREPINMNHPYVYVNSTYQMKEFIEKTQQLISNQPLLREKTVQVATEETWPIPIVFSKFYNLNYFNPTVKVEFEALMYLVDSKDQKVFEDKLREFNQSSRYQVFTLDVRQSRAPILVYTQREHFQNLFSWQQADLQGGAL